MAPREKIPGGRAGAQMQSTMQGTSAEDKKKAHRGKLAGPSAEKKKVQDKKKRGLSTDRENPKVSPLGRRYAQGRRAGDTEY